jgi:hypothetical protein
MQVTAAPALAAWNVRPCPVLDRAAVCIQRGFRSATKSAAAAFSAPKVCSVLPRCRNVATRAATAAQHARLPQAALQGRFASKRAPAQVFAFWNAAKTPTAPRV